MGLAETTPCMIQLVRYNDTDYYNGFTIAVFVPQVRRNFSALQEPELGDIAHSCSEE